MYVAAFICFLCLPLKNIELHQSTPPETGRETDSTHMHGVSSAHDGDVDRGVKLMVREPRDQKANILVHIFEDVDSKIDAKNRKRYKPLNITLIITCK
jgi:hypothetical protein